MSEWWLLVAIFWFWYLADSVKAGRRLRFTLSRAFGRARAPVRHETLTLVSPSPAGWYVRTEDPPFAVSPEGLSNLPVGSAGRPAPLPSMAKAWRWEEIRQLSARRGKIYINGEYFCAITPFSTAIILRDLIDGCKTRVGADREAWLKRWIARWFHSAKLKRQHRILVGRTGSLAIWAGFGLVLCALISAYLLAGNFLPLSDEHTAKIGRILPLLGLYLLGLHICLVIAGWLAHRRLLPKRGEARFSLIFGAFLLPPQAYRLRSRIGAEYFSTAHPAAWLAAVGAQKDFILYARQMLTDLHWPLSPAHVDEGKASLVQNIGCWMREQVTAQLVRLLKSRGMSEDQLLAAPEKDCAESCAYCPRCGSQFTTTQARCAQGIELKRYT